jgi:hypothetical protein
MKIAQLSSDPDACYWWILDATNGEVTMEDLADAGDHKKVDTELGAYLVEHVRKLGPLYESIDSYVRDNRVKKKLVSGRQILRLMEQYFATDEASGGTFDVEDFFAVKLKGKSLEQFLKDLDDVVDKMREPPREDILRHHLYTNFQEFKPLERAIHDFDDVDCGDTKKTAHFLRQQAEKIIRKARQAKNRKSEHAQFAGVLAKPAAAAPKAKPKAKAKTEPGPRVTNERISLALNSSRENVPKLARTVSSLILRLSLLPFGRTSWLERRLERKSQEKARVKARSLGPSPDPKAIGKGSRPKKRRRLLANSSIEIPATAGISVNGPMILRFVRRPKKRRRHNLRKRFVVFRLDRGRRAR